MTVDPRECFVWNPRDTAPRDTLVIGALYRDGKVWRVTDAKHTDLGWYTRAGEACPWVTHWCRMPTIIVEVK